MKRRIAVRSSVHVPPPAHLVDPSIEDFVSADEAQDRPSAERLALTRWREQFEEWAGAGRGLPPASIDVMLWERQAGIGNVWPV